MRKEYLISSTVPLYLAALSIQGDKFIFAALFLCMAFALLYKAGVAEPDEYDN